MKTESQTEKRIKMVLAEVPLAYCAKIEGDALYVETRATVEALDGQFDAKGFV